MSPNSFIGTEQPVTLADIQAIESAHQYTLPTDYKAHIPHVNEGYPQADQFVTTGTNGETSTYRVNKFYSIKYGGSGALQTALEDLRDQIHPDLVPFADDAGGDQFCLSVGPEDYGAVYYISHESYVPPFGEEIYDEATDKYLDAPAPAPQQYGEGVYFLALSFRSFLEGLVDAPNEV